MASFNQSEDIISEQNSYCFFKMGQSRPLFVYFRSFLITISIIQIEKAQMVCLGFEPRAKGWQVQTKPRSYGGHPNQNSYCYSEISLQNQILKYLKLYLCNYKHEILISPRSTSRIIHDCSRNCFFIKMGQPQPLLSFIFGLFKQTSLQFLQQIYVKKFPSSKRCRDSNHVTLELVIV